MPVDVTLSLTLTVGLSSDMAAGRRNLPDSARIMYKAATVACVYRAKEHSEVSRGPNNDETERPTTRQRREP